MDRPNARDLMLEHKQKSRERAKIFEQIVEKVYHRIAVKAKHNWTRTIYEVPSYVVGMPIYDLELCVRYVVNKLQKNGYYVEMYPRGVIYVSWDKDEIQP